MPIIYLDRTERDRQIAGAVRQLDPSCEVRETEQRIVISSSATIRLLRRRLEEVLGGAMSDEEWRSKFSRAIGEVVTYSGSEYVIQEEPPGDF